MQPVVLIAVPVVVIVVVAAAATVAAMAYQQWPRIDFYAVFYRLFVT